MVLCWTPRRDRELQANPADGFTRAASDTRARMRELRAAATPRGRTIEPRAPLPTPLIDISRAPSSMEMAAARWKTGATR